MDAAPAMLPAPGAEPLPAGPDGRRVWVYDCEVFPDAFLCLLSDGREWRRFDERELPALARFVTDDGIALAGYNSAAFDDHLLARVVARPDIAMADLARFAQGLISDERERMREPAVRAWGCSIDLFQLLGGRGSLKEWACRLGHADVAECPVPFDQPLPPDRRADVEAYCRVDVEVTLHLLRSRWRLLELREMLRRRFELDARVYALSEAALAQHAFLSLHARRGGQAAAQVRQAARTHANNTARAFAVAPLLSSRVAFATAPFQELHERLRGASLAAMDEEGAVWALSARGVDLGSVALAGTTIALGTGGLHSVDRPGVYDASDEVAIIDLDVTSYYPSLMIHERIHPPQLGPSFTEDLARLRAERIAAKRAGDKASADALKIVINSVYGKLNDRFSPLRSLPDAHRVTLNGQLFLLMLIEGLHEAGAEILSANTDGVTVRAVGRTVQARVDAVAAGWCERTALELERTAYTRLCRRDVNSYIALAADGSVKSRGAFNADAAKGDGTVIKRAAAAHLLRGEDPAAIIDAERSAEPFLFWCRARRGIELWHGEERLGQVARWYASIDGESLRRRGADGAWGTVSHGRAARLALRIGGWTRQELTRLDRRHYVDEAWKLVREVQGDAQQQSIFG